MKKIKMYITFSYMYNKIIIIIIIKKYIFMYICAWAH
jgi:hypothetical protein